MKTTDIIMLNVTGTNGKTRKQATVAKSFNGDGLLLDDKGQVVTGSTEKLVGLPSGSVEAPPVFPQDALQAASAKLADLATRDDGSREMQEIQLAYAKQVKAYQERVGSSGNEKSAIVQAILRYLRDFHDFRQEDGEWFVIKPENLDLNIQTLSNGSRSFRVSGAAVFGAA